MGFIKDVKKLKDSLNKLKSPKITSGVKFSIVYLKDKEIYIQGFITFDDLPYSEVFKSFFEQIPVTEEVYIEIHHLIYINNIGELRDATKNELDMLVDYFDTLLDDGVFYLEEVLYLDVPAEEE